MAFRMKMRKGVNIPRVVTKIFGTVIALYVGGTVLTQLGTVMNNTASPFYQGLTLIGWTVDTNNRISATTGTGVLSVVGIIGIGAVVLEFVQFSW